MTHHLDIKIFQCCETPTTTTGRAPKLSEYFECKLTNQKSAISSINQLSSVLPASKTIFGNNCFICPCLSVCIKGVKWKGKQRNELRKNRTVSFLVLEQNIIFHATNVNFVIRRYSESVFGSGLVVFWWIEVELVTAGRGQALWGSLRKDGALEISSA